MTEKYFPQTGSIAKRALLALQQLEFGTELSSAALLEAIGQPTDWAGIHACMEDAVTAGLVKKRTAGRLSYWSIPVDSVSKDLGPVVVDVAKIGAASFTAPAPASRPAAPKKSKPVQAPQPEDLAFMSESGFDCALSKSGRLSITVDGSTLILNLEYTQQLFQYLDRMREPSA